MLSSSSSSSGVLWRSKIVPGYMFEAIHLIKFVYFQNGLCSKPLCIKSKMCNHSGLTILCLIPRTTVTSLSAPKDTCCKTHPLCVNHGVPFWMCEKTHKLRMRWQASLTSRLFSSETKYRVHLRFAICEMDASSSPKLKHYFCNSFWDASPLRCSTLAYHRSMIYYFRSSVWTCEMAMVFNPTYKARCTSKTNCR